MSNSIFNNNNRRPSGPVLRSLSPSSNSTPSFASSTASTFSSNHHLINHHHHHHHHNRSASPTRVNLIPSSSQPIRFATSPIQSAKPVHRPQKKTCMCSPTNHPGSFRCSLHKNQTSQAKNQPGPYQSNRLYARRSAMTNSLVRIGTVEGDLVKRALAALIRPSSHHQKRRGDFQPRKSRFSVVGF